MLKWTSSFKFADICFLRLDFEVFTILGTGGTTEIGGGICVDSFTIVVRQPFDKIIKGYSQPFKGLGVTFFFFPCPLIKQLQCLYSIWNLAGYYEI